MLSKVKQMKYSASFKLQVVKFVSDNSNKEEPDCDVYDDRITPEQWQELFGESNDEEEFHGFWRKTNKQTNGSFRSHQMWEKKWPMLHSFEVSFRVK